MTEKMRLTLLCEDRRHERFLRLLFEARVWEKHFDPAPRGDGAAEAWVRRRYAHHVRLLRRKHRERVALVVMVDGDREGPITRKKRLDDALADEGLAVRSVAERIAVLVPTWSIETWLLAAAGRDVSEEVALKHSFEQDPPKSSTAAAWQTGCSLPSCADARAELLRVGWSSAP